MSTIYDIIESIGDVELRSKGVFPHTHFDEYEQRLSASPFDRGLLSNEITALVTAYQNYRHECKWSKDHRLFAAAKQLARQRFPEYADEAMHRSADGNVLTLFTQPRGMRRDTTNPDSHSYTMPQTYREKLVFSIEGVPLMSTDDQLVPDLMGQRIGRDQLASSLPELAARFWPTEMTDVPEWIRKQMILHLPRNGDIYPVSHYTFAHVSAFRFGNEEQGMHGVREKRCGK